MSFLNDQGGELLAPLARVKPDLLEDCQCELAGEFEALTFKEFSRVATVGYEVYEVSKGGGLGGLGSDNVRVRENAMFAAIASLEISYAAVSPFSLEGEGLLDLKTEVLVFGEVWKRFLDGVPGRFHRCACSTPLFMFRF